MSNNVGNSVGNEKIAVVKGFYQRMDDEYGLELEERAIHLFLDPDVIFHFPDTDIEGAENYWAYVSQFSNGEVKIWHVLDDVQVAEDDENKVDVGFIDLRGETADGEVWSMPGSATYKVIGDRIVEAWVRADSDEA